MLLVGQEVGGQRQPTPGQDRHETVLTEGADETVEGHGGEMQMMAQSSKLSPPCVAKRALRATSGRIER